MRLLQADGNASGVRAPRGSSHPLGRGRVHRRSPRPRCAALGRFFRCNPHGTPRQRSPVSGQPEASKLARGTPRARQPQSSAAPTSGGPLPQPRGAIGRGLSAHVNDQTHTVDTYHGVNVSILTLRRPYMNVDRLSHVCLHLRDTLSMNEYRQELPAVRRGAETKRVVAARSLRARSRSALPSVTVRAWPEQNKSVAA